MGRRAKDPHKRQERRLAALTRLTRSNTGDWDNSWQKWKNCFFCGDRICVNNYEDRKSRTPKFRDKVVCPRCTPYSPIFRDKIWRPLRYKMLMSVILVEKFAALHEKRIANEPGYAEEHENCKCLFCASVKVSKITNPEVDHSTLED